MECHSWRNIHLFIDTTRWSIGIAIYTPECMGDFSINLTFLCFELDIILYDKKIFQGGGYDES
jgi:hypothetical protein